MSHCGVYMDNVRTRDMLKEASQERVSVRESESDRLHILLNLFRWPVFWLVLAVSFARLWNVDCFSKSVPPGRSFRCLLTPALLDKNYYLHLGKSSGFFPHTSNNYPDSVSLWRGKAYL